MVRQSQAARGRNTGPQMMLKSYRGPCGLPAALLLHRPVAPQLEKFCTQLLALPTTKPITWHPPRFHLITSQRAAAGEQMARGNLCTALLFPADESSHISKLLWRPSVGLNVMHGEIVWLGW